MPRHPVDQLEAGRSFFAGLDLDVSHFAALWHSFKVGEHLAKDMNAIGDRHGLSIADFHLLGALMIDWPKPMRAMDLALTLQLSNAVMSTRIGKLARKGYLSRVKSETDHRAIELHLTREGADTVRDLGLALEQESQFIRHYRRLPETDRLALGRIMGDLHTRMARDFLPVVRPKL
jgi:DNA-binding MarR family transcriptional regulator